MVSERALDLRGESDPSPFGDLLSIRLVSMRLALVLGISWANECVALAVQVVSRHRGHLP